MSEITEEQQKTNKLLVLDTNVFISDPRFEQSAWLLLRRFDFKIAVPTVVLDETLPKLASTYFAKIQTLRECVKATRNVLQQVQNNPMLITVNVPNPQYLEDAFTFLENLNYDIPANLLKIVAGFVTSIANKSYSEVELMPYCSINHKDLVVRCCYAACISAAWETHSVDGPAFPHE